MYPLLRIRSLPGSSGRSLITPPVPPPLFTYDYIVSPTGGTGAGTLADPWSLPYAMSGAGGLVVPGTKLGLRGGQYVTGASRVFTIPGSLGGGIDSLSGKIIWKAYERERAEIICDTPTASIETIKVDAAYNWLWDLEVWRKKTDRYNYPGPGTNIWIRNASVTGVKLIDCVTHEGSNGVFTDSQIGDVEIYGHVAYHAGVSTDPKAHGFYFHHARSGSTRFRITNYTTFHHLGLCGQTFASAAPEQLDDFDFDCVIAWGGGRLAFVSGQHQNLSMGGSDGTNIPLRGSTFRRIHSWNPIGYGRSPLRFYGLGSNGSDAIIEDNYLVGGSDAGLGRLYLQSGMGWTSVAVRRNVMVSLNAVAILRTEDTVYTAYTWEDNQFYGAPAGATRWHGGASDRTWAAWKAFTGLGNAPGHPDTESDSLPTSTYVLVRNNDKYEAGRGIVAYWNWASLTYVPANLLGFLSPGDSFYVKNVQDLYGANITVYSDAAGLNPTTTVPGDGVVWFPTTGVTPPTPYGFNNPTLDAWVNLAPMTAPFFDEFIVRKPL